MRLDASGEARLGAHVLGVELQRLLVGLGRVLVLVQAEIGVAEQHAGPDAAAPVGRLRGRVDDVAVVLLLERDLRQADQRLAAIALGLGHLLEEGARFGEPLGAKQPLRLLELVLVVGGHDVGRGLGLGRGVAVVGGLVLGGLGRPPRPRPRSRPLSGPRPPLRPSAPPPGPARPLAPWRPLPLSPPPPPAPPSARPPRRRPPRGRGGRESSSWRPDKPRTRPGARPPRTRPAFAWRRPAGRGHSPGPPRRAARPAPRPGGPCPIRPARCSRSRGTESWPGWSARARTRPSSAGGRRAPGPSTA